MKHIRFLAAVALTFAFGSVVRAETAAKPAAITIVGVQGEARYSVDGKAWHPLVVGKILREGAVIETAQVLPATSSSAANRFRFRKIWPSRKVRRRFPTLRTRTLLVMFPTNP